MPIRRYSAGRGGTGGGLSVESLTRGILAEKLTSEKSLVLHILEVEDLGGSGLFEIQYDPSRVFTKDGDPEVLDDRFSEAKIKSLEDGEEENHYEGEVVFLHEEKDRITARFPKGIQPRPKDKIELFPFPFLEQLLQWARNLTALPPRFLALNRILAAEEEEENFSLGKKKRRGLRASQREALEKAGRQVFLIWGPPGTGKTFTLASIIAEHLAAGRTVLALSNNNVAVDLLTLAIDDACKRIGRDLQPEELIRTGRPRLETLLHDPGRAHLLAWTKTLEEFRRMSLALRSESNRIQARLNTPGKAKEAEKKDLRRRLAEIELQVRALEEERGRILTRYAENAICVCSTFMSFLWNRLIRNRSYDITAVDEASTVPLAAVSRLLEDDRRGFIFAGDFMQLPPISKAQNRSKHAKYWISRSIFNHVGALDPHKREFLRAKGSLVLLKEQSRMRPAICEAVSRSFYGGELTPVDPPSPPPVSSPIPKDPILILDPFLIPLPEGDHLASRAPIKVHPRGRAWDRSASLIRATLRLYLEQAQETGWPEKILAVTPFRAQAKLLAKLVEPLDPDRIRTGTVHKMQGAEADLVFFDPLEPLHPWLSRGKDAPNLINVSLSRARQQLVLLGNREALAGNPHLRTAVDLAVFWFPE